MKLQVQFLLTFVAFWKRLRSMFFSFNRGGGGCISSYRSLHLLFTGDLKLIFLQVLSVVPAELSVVLFFYYVSSLLLAKIA